MYCKYCGHELNSDNICTNPECPSNSNNNCAENNYGNDYENYYSEYKQNPNEFRDENGISTSEMIAFVGEKKADYYLDKWTDYQNNENFISWNWPAFLCGFYWFWYRKMYSIVAIILAVSMCSAIFLPDWICRILSLGIIIGSGLFGNQLYMKHAVKKITSMKSLLSRGADYSVIMRRIRLNGGTTIVPIIVLIVLFILLIFLFLLLIILGASLTDTGFSTLY